METEKLTLEKASVYLSIFAAILTIYVALRQLKII